MTDPRIKTLAKTLVEHSISTKEGDKVIISGTVKAAPLIKELYTQLMKKGAIPILDITLEDTTYDFFNLANQKQINIFPQHSYNLMKMADAIIRIYSPINTRELTNITPSKITDRGKVLKKIKDEMLKKRWVLVAYPTNSLAQEADMSLSEFKDFVYNATNQDWKKIEKNLNKIKKKLDPVKNIQIIGEKTKISFSLKGKRGVICAGKCNMPDGEVFYSPVETSTNGKISFSFPTIMQGREIDGITLEFKNGKVIKATAKKNEKFLQEMLKTDKGASYLGEFGIGLNYKLKKNIKDILFDEKLGGTIHLALGNAYPDAQGVNKSAIHWDMIKDLRQKGEIYADGKKVFEKGKWLV